MRYYSLVLTPSTSGGVSKTWTSYPNGRFDPGAQNIIYDMPVAPSAEPIGMQSLTIEGISLDDLQQSQQFAGSNLSLTIGMGGGMPLENPNQVKLAAYGSVFQSFGNWVGTDMTLDFIITPSIYTTKTPGNFQLVWKKGQPLSSALQQCLQTSYHGTGLTVNVNINQNIIAPENITHVVPTLTSLARWIAAKTSKSSSGAVQIVAQNGVILAYDRTYLPTPINIEYTDLIGQPTWLEPFTMQMKLVARGDIQVGDTIMLPQGYLTNAAGAVTTTAASYPSSNRYKSTFAQGFFVTKLRQIGNFRSSDGGEWATILNCTPNVT